MAARARNPEEPIVIKKYANRRLYNTDSSSYITLDTLAKMTREEVEFQVVDAKSGDDITHQVLTQIIMDEEAHGEHMLPVSFLRQLISLYGNSMQAMVPSYLDASMKSFRDNQEKLRDTFGKGLAGNPFAKMAQQNMKMFADGWRAVLTAGQDKPADGDEEGETKDELAELRAQMTAMQDKLDKLGK
ncbi:polyhydroxyalkanoate synthesis repressor PhaR [Pseudoblastomonas halimionae]|uniref:Polyhydroxyalkanoate synthesis repressor PhaR n=1 Tax=Alteriqipengyuania halimionae TaxID=1926630 RepID=A0A6I4U3F8_9SPHN|nr:polyhydroxyalkanoate synthesis repressor PhaR [Alteriqipengyuania halimionae]MXP09473.1 polyhydroxyalkanoate synthesis repressor PhaR [Alteriqipengyuania halimionae]